MAQRTKLLLGITFITYSIRCVSNQPTTYHETATKSLVSDIQTTMAHTQQALVNLPANIYALLPSYKQVLPYAALVGAAGTALRQGVLMASDGWRLLANDPSNTKGKQRRRKGMFYMAGSATLIAGGLLTLKYTSRIVTALNENSN